MINNYFKPGPATPDTDIRHRIVKPELRVSKAGAPTGYPKVYAAGNIVDGDEAVTKDNWDGGVQFELPGQKSSPEDAQTAETKDPRLQALLAKVKSDTRLPMPPITIQSAGEAYEAVLANAGATLPKRDPVDQRVIEEVRTGKTGDMGKDTPITPPKGLAKNNIGTSGNGIITDIAQVGGYPDYKGDPITYTQHDGIPDGWKKKYNLDVNDPDLASKDCNGDGYTNIEKYLDGLDPTQKIDWTDPKNNTDHLTPDKFLASKE